jgi:outer membrane protein TolC
MQRQPNLKAARSSLEAAELGKESLYTVGRLAERLSPDVPIRRQQAERGIIVARAELEKVHNETVYDVTRLYWTYVYARQQERTATDVIEQLEVFQEVLESIIKTGVPGKLNNFTLYTMKDSIGEVRILRDKAATGQKQALGALREAMGVEPDFEFHPKDTELPILEGVVTKDQVVEAAVTRRPELAQAAAGVDAFRLEVCAQGMIRFRKSVPTLASGSDLHSRQVPMAVRNGEYRPGALAPEMPPSLVGRTESRVARATELSRRQDAVYEKTLGLVQLEAVNAFTSWEGTTARMREAKAKYENARQMVTQAREVLAVKTDPELIIRSEALAGRAQAEYLEAVFEHVKALATLERVTAGAIRPGFVGR